MSSAMHTRSIAHILLVLSIAAALSGDDPAVARGPQVPQTRVYQLDPSTHGNPEGIAVDPRNGAFFVGIIWDGTIYRGTLDSPVLTPYIEGGPDLQAVGLKAWQGRLYVAGGFLGDVRVYDIDSRALVASFVTGEGGLLNDLVVTPQGDVFVTDSVRDSLWHISAAQVAAGSGTPREIPVGPEIDYAYGEFVFNLNGIVALNGGRRLIAANSFDGRLYRIDIDDSAPNGRTIRAVDMEPLYADGLLLDQGRLVAVTFDQPGLAFVELNADASAGDIVRRLSDPSFRDPSTVARARDFYLVVNFDLTTSTPPFTVTAIPRTGGWAD